MIETTLTYNEMLNEGRRRWRISNFRLYAASWGYHGRVEFVRSKCIGPRGIALFTLRIHP